MYTACIPAGKINLYYGCGMRLSAFLAVNDYVWSRSLVENYGDGLTELTAIWIYIPHVVSMRPWKEN